ncbi:uncharacterized protein JCM15063_000056 [Sporobolomyces koalae]|uniref:uncharacterized protein n=1 Tax=Sporobolomyces koalae TaxID=500713 RepID=UPI00316FDD91
MNRTLESRSVAHASTSGSERGAARLSTRGSPRLVNAPGPHFSPGASASRTAALPDVVFLHSGEHQRPANIARLCATPGRPTVVLGMARVSGTVTHHTLDTAAVHEQAPPSPPPVAALPQPSPLASFAAEMFVWLWFATDSANDDKQDPASDRDNGSGTSARLQFSPSRRFVGFCHDVLTTTQVSHSVVLLALLFVSRLKQKNVIAGAAGSEFRLAVTGLMLANKVLDDNTYTAQTWSQVSSLELKPLVAGEAEFLKGLDWSLHVSEREFRSFLKLLEGHVAARNARLGRLPRKIATNSRVLHHVDVRPAPIGTEHGIAAASFPSQGQEITARAERSVRQKVDRGAASANSTPTMSWAVPLFPPIAPASAPPPEQPSNILDRDAHAKPPALVLGSLPNSQAGTDRHKKRNYEEASQRASYPIVPHMLVSHQPPPMARSRSSAAALSSSRPVWAFTSDPRVSPRSRPQSLTPLGCTPQTGFPHSALGPATHDRMNQFNTLANSFSPRYDPSRPAHQRISSLDYYSLAAGQGQGYLHQMTPPSAPLVASLHAPYPQSSRHLTHAFAQYPVPPHSSQPSYGRSGSGSLASSPYQSARSGYAPQKSSVLSGLRSSPPATAPSNSRPAPLTSPLAPTYAPQAGHFRFGPVGALDATFAPVPPTRRSSQAASSPGAPLFDTGTSTPRPGTGNSATSDFAFRPARVPLATGLAAWPHIDPGLALPPIVSAPWSAYANAGPPGVYWPSHFAQP